MRSVVTWTDRNGEVMTFFLNPDDLFAPDGTDPQYLTPDTGRKLDTEELAKYVAGHLDGTDIIWLGEEWWVDTDGEPDSEMLLVFAPDEAHFTRMVRVKVTVEIMST